MRWSFSSPQSGAKVIEDVTAQTQIPIPFVTFRMALCTFYFLTNITYIGSNIISLLNITEALKYENVNLVLLFMSLD